VGTASSPKPLVHRRQRQAAIPSVQHWPALDERRCTRQIAGSMHPTNWIAVNNPGYSVTTGEVCLGRQRIVKNRLDINFPAAIIVRLIAVSISNW
jgi:hypothetical protein